MSATIPTTAPFFLSSRSSTGAFDPSSSSPFFCSRDAAPRSQRAPDARKNASFFCFRFFLLSRTNLRRRRKRFLTEKKAGGGDLFETRRAREERWTRRDANARKRLFCARARVGSTTNRVARGRAKEVSEKMCAHECPMLLFGGVSPPFILFPLLCEGDASRGLGFDADIGDVVSSPSKTNEQAPELPSRPRPPRGQSPASNSTSKPSKTKSLAPSSPKSNARTTRLENRKSPRASKRSEP